MNECTQACDLDRSIERFLPFPFPFQNIAHIQRVSADGEAAELHLAAVAADAVLGPRPRADRGQRHLVLARAPRGRLPPSHEGGQHARLPGGWLRRAICLVWSVAYESTTTKYCTCTWGTRA